MDNHLQHGLMTLYEKINSTDITNRQIVLDYTSLWWDHNDAYRCNGTISHRTDSGFINHINLNTLNNIALVSATDSPTFFTKKALFISDNIILNDMNPDASAHLMYQFEDTPPNVSAQTSISYKAYLQTDYIEDIGLWIRNNKKLILSEYAIFFPNIKMEYQTENRFDGGLDRAGVEYPSTAEFKDILAAKSNITSSMSRSFVDDTYMRAIAEIDIPYIEGVSSDVMIKLIEDRSDVFASCRLGLKKSFLELDRANGSEQFDYITKKIGIDIQDSVREIQSELKKINRRTFFKTTGAVATFTTATLVAVNSVIFDPSMINTTLAYLGSGGGFITLSGLVGNHLEEKQLVKDRPYYFIWLLHKAK